jgi:hypothetical protein
MRKLGVLSGIVLAMVLGCGGGSSGFNPGVPGNKPLGTLSPSEAKTLCTNTFAHVQQELNSSAGREGGCRAVGAYIASTSGGANATDLQIQFACTAGYTLCQQTLADGGAAALGGGADGGVDPCAATTTAPSTCTATVDQYSACVNENDDALLNTYPPCNQLTKAKLAMLTAADGGITGAYSSGPACAAFTAACPGVPVTTGFPPTGM